MKKEKWHKDYDANGTRFIVRETDNDIKKVTYLLTFN